jgi:predicted heme/steroid binding protein
MKNRIFTEEELRHYDGKNGAPSFIACNGRVFDVSNSFLWQNGCHQAMHNAGQDLTESLERAPHLENLLEKFPVVGILHKKK